MSFHRPAGFSDDDDSDSDYECEYSPQFIRNSDNGQQTYHQEKSESKESLFYSALKNEDIETMRSMLVDGFHIDQPLPGGWSPLMHACLLGSLPVIEFLIKEGANVNFNKELFTPLMALCKSSSSNQDDLVKGFDLLLENNANVNAMDRHATTALMNACNSGHIELVKKLLECKCDINAQDTLGMSALFHAVNGGQEDVVRVLMEGKARVDLIDKQRRSAFDLAILKGYEHLGKLVCSKKERRRLIEEQDDECLPVPCLTTKDPVEELFAQLPASNTKSSSGFSSDIVKLLSAMELRHFIKLFEENNVQLNEFLLITDEKLKDLGVRFSVHRQRILSSIKKLHVHQWNKASLGVKPRNQTIHVGDGVKLMCNVTKHLHILNATLNFVRIHQPIPIQLKVFESIESVLHQVDLISKELNAIQSFSSFLKNKEKLEPVDLIKPTKRETRFNTFIITTVFVGFVLLYREKVFVKKLFSVNIW